MVNGMAMSGERTCNSDGSCSERLELELQPGSIWNIDIIVRDASFSDGSTRLQYLVPDEQLSPTLIEDSKSDSGGTLVAAMIVVPLLALVGWLLFQFKKPPQKQTSIASSGGLLARVEAEFEEL